MTTQQWPQSGEAVKPPFQRISLGIVYYDSFVFTDGPSRIVTIQLIVGPKKVVREPIYIPNTTD
ncbi:hypothetical protein [Spirosoma spitsbergense]|uniref:hypothetical protein n=1 Tax=Spirosoma spitsbergense TaxID=431554 RepID=UPI0003691F68|nr:hypothetical protein [Spirosoma spitsbergense]